MTRDEARSVFLELKKFYPYARQLKSGSTLEAYGDVLKNYDFSAVMDVVKEYVLTHKFFPDISDLVGALAPIARGEARTSRNQPADWMLPYIDALIEQGRDIDPITRYASEHGTTWGEAKQRLEAQR